jgi:hypothetical protein
LKVYDGLALGKEGRARAGPEGHSPGAEAPIITQITFNKCHKIDIHKASREDLRDLGHFHFTTKGQRKMLPG